MMSLYGAVSFQPTVEQQELRDKKLKNAIEYLGDKYLLAKPVRRLNHGS
jgi:hypothetical protein